MIPTAGRSRICWRRSPLVALSLAVAAVSLIPSPARAWTAPGQEPASPAVVQLAERALTFWRAHGLTTCGGGVVVWEAPSLRIGSEDAWGRGDGTTCELWASAVIARVVIEVPEIHAALDACTVIAHEVGHALGLAHSARGVMSADPFAWPPKFCRRWARFFYRAVMRGEGFSEAEIRAFV